MRQTPLFRTSRTHSGAEFESGAANRARGVNEPQPEGEPDCRAPEPSGVTEQTSEWQGGHDNWAESSGRRKKLRATPSSKQVSHRGNSLTIFKGEHAAEDERWVYVVEVKGNGSKKYICVRCGSDFTGDVGRILAHCLRIGGTAKPCVHQPSNECRLVLQRVQDEKEKKSLKGGRAGSASLASDTAVARTPPVSFGTGVTRVNAVDKALARWCVAHDIPWAAVDSREKLFVQVIEAVQLAGTSYKLPKRDVLSEDQIRGEEVTVLPSHPISSNPIPSYPTPPHPIPPHPMGNPILSPSPPIPSHPIPSYPTPSHPVLTCCLCRHALVGSTSPWWI